ncbi:endonuclease MutS2 [Culicoidibacter larvae]|uniref:Endonuclease MutS2 n=1 Tax=Culicoidibacter larvae TaxID=2579976 RepID=A0A5R8QFG8_9FIRM|nr:endonuclease MutS2 [Culicoidibacter larvae]TLG76738.1 endonuclease MutS2 [Culicoidibacter larvae]
MIRPQAMDALDFEAVREQFMTHATSSATRDYIARLVPQTDLTTIQIMQAQTDESLRLFYRYQRPRFNHLFPVHDLLHFVAADGILEIETLMELAFLLENAKQVHQYLEMIEQPNEYPHLWATLNHVYYERAVVDKIWSVISEDGKIKDSASSELRRIRRAQSEAERLIRKTMATIMQKYASQLMEQIYTLRNDRFVVPVRSEYKNSFPGIIHGESATRTTVYIEPQEIVVINNTLSDLYVQEREEIQKILFELSQLVKEHAPSVAHNAERFIELDFLFAKAAYAAEFDATMPDLNIDNVIDIKQGRHPLIDAKYVIANDVRIGKEYQTIVITGPNTGGKTVVLKMLGLFTIMAQLGLHIPAREGSQLAVFEQIFTEIGDEQSIEQNLSTFSAHMQHVVGILNDVDEKSLVLFDELGSGTDPKEGAALAIGILEYVYQRGAITVATTHYPELKIYAYESEHVMNASVIFDVEKLMPTYQLELGMPGHSNAFDIAGRLGLQADVLTTARRYIDEREENIDQVIRRFEEEARKFVEVRTELAATKAKAEELEAQLHAEYDRLDVQKERVLDQARREANKFVEDAQKQSEAIIREIKEERHQLKDHELVSARTRLKGLKHETKNVEQERGQKQNNYAVGDVVYVKTLQSNGSIIEQLKNDQWLVKVGSFQTKVKTDDLRFLKAKEQKKQEQNVRRKISSRAGIQLDLRGERLADALDKLEKYLDQAQLAGYDQVAIIHGHGTGALRTGVQEYLKQSPIVKNFRFGGEGEGGVGATIATLK